MLERADPHVEFEDLYLASEQTLRRALVAAYGREIGNEATDEAFAWAWEHRERLAQIEKPIGYLFRVGQTSARRLRARPLNGRPPEWQLPPEVEPGLVDALRSLSESQRVAVVLHHGYALTYREIADYFDIQPSTVQNHVERGMKKLKRRIRGPQ